MSVSAIMGGGGMSIGGGGIIPIGGGSIIPIGMGGVGIPMGGVSGGDTG